LLEPPEPSALNGLYLAGALLGEEEQPTKAAAQAMAQRDSFMEGC